MLTAQKLQSLSPSLGATAHTMAGTVVLQASKESLYVGAPTARHLVITKVATKPSRYGSFVLFDGGMSLEVSTGAAQSTTFTSGEVQFALTLSSEFSSVTEASGGGAIFNIIQHFEGASLVTTAAGILLDHFLGSILDHLGNPIPVTPLVFHAIQDSIAGEVWGSVTESGGHSYPQRVWNLSAQQTMHAGGAPLQFEGRSDMSVSHVMVAGGYLYIAGDSQLPYLSKTHYDGNASIMLVRNMAASSVTYFVGACTFETSLSAWESLVYCAGALPSLDVSILGESVTLIDGELLELDSV